MNLYEELGRIQFQLDKLNEAKMNITKQIEIQSVIEQVNNQKPSEKSDPKKGQDED